MAGANSSPYDGSTTTNSKQLRLSLSRETLLSPLDPYKRRSPLDRERTHQRIPTNCQQSDASAKPALSTGLFSCVVRRRTVERIAVVCSSSRCNRVPEDMVSF